MEAATEHAAQHQVSRHVAASRAYFRLRLVDESRPRVRPSGAALLAALTEALRQLHGAAGAATRVRLLGFHAATCTGVVRVAAADARRVGAAASLLQAVRGEPMRLDVLAHSRFLASLALDSRTFGAQLMVDTEAAAARKGTFG